MGGIYNFVTKRGLCKGVNSKISWTQVETGSAITWKYPSCVLLGDNSIGEFYSVALTNHHQQADTGTKMVHIGRNTRSRIIIQGHLGRAVEQQLPRAGEDRAAGGRRAQLFAVRLDADRLEVRRQHVSPTSRCRTTAPRWSTRRARPRSARTSSSISRSRGIGAEEAVSMIINGFCRDVFQQLPMEFAVEATKLLGLKLEGSVG